MKIVIVGHVDHGKSSLIGRLLFETKSLSQDKMNDIQKISKALGKEIELAFLIDHLKEERERNMTIDSSQLFFETQKRRYTIIDAPGHFELIKNMLTGASQAEAAILVIDAKAGIQEQTKRHAYLLKMLGIQTLIVAINKIDLISNENAVLKVLQDQILAFLHKLNLFPAFIIPISAKEGINISKLIEALDMLPSKSEDSKPLRMPVQDIYLIDGKKIIVGKVASGSATSGENFSLYPLNQEVMIDSIVEKKKAYAGENIGIIFKQNVPCKRGDILADINTPPKMAKEFTANLFWLGENPLILNTSLLIRCATQEKECKIIHIQKRMNSSSLEILEDYASHLYLHEASQVTFETHDPLTFDSFSFIAETGRFILEDNQTNILGAGTLI